MEEFTLKTCIACGYGIPEGADVCSTCGSYQRAWRNNLRYTANIIGILSVVAGVLVFAISSLPEVRKALAWRDEVALLSFQSTQSISIANIGDGEVFVTHLHIEGQTPEKRKYSKTERVNQSISPGKVVAIERDPSEFISISDGYGIGVSDDLQIISDLDEKANIISPEEKSCILRVFAVPGDAGYEDFMDYYEGVGKNMVTFKAQAYARFYSLVKRDYIIQDIPMEGYFLIKSDPQCKLTGE